MRIGARGSPLSLAQTGQFRDILAQAHPGQSFEIVPITTSGDRIQDRRLIDAGGKGLFTKELDEALLDCRVDFAVHSMKDLPTQLPDGVVLACTPAREDPRDALICEKASQLLDLPANAKIGTASLRRQAQLLSLGSRFEIVMLRGNVDTRLRKVATGEVDATLLAYAGLRRLGLSAHATSLIDPIQSPPAAGQGALAVTARDGDRQTLAVLAPLDDRASRLETTAERALLAALDGSCRTPIAALGRWSEGRLWFVGEALTPEGVHRWRRTCHEACADDAEARAIGRKLGDSIRLEAGDALYKETDELAVNIN
jgi:hydroxymethylbilane synthase